MDQSGELPPQQQLCVILDACELDLTTLLRPSIGAGLELVRQLRAHYPQRMAHLHMVHAPALARWLVGTICSMADSRTAKKVHVHDAAGPSLLGRCSHAVGGSAQVLHARPAPSPPLSRRCGSR